MASLIHSGRATYAFFAQSCNLTKRFWIWEIVWLVYSLVETLAVTFIGEGAGKITGVKFDTGQLILYLLIGSLVWSYLSVNVVGLAEMVTIERWEGSIEYTFMAPVSRLTYLIGHGWFTLIFSLLFSIIQLVIISLFFHLDLSHANYITATFIVLLGSIPFLGIAIAAAVLPLLRPELGQAMAEIVSAILLLISGVYYPVEALPAWIQPLARISPATYVLHGLRAGLLHNQSIWSAEIWNDTWPLLVSGVVSIPASIYIFRLVECYMKRHGKLARSG